MMEPISVQYFGSDAIDVTLVIPMPFQRRILGFCWQHHVGASGTVSIMQLSLSSRMVTSQFFPANPPSSAPTGAQILWSNYLRNASVAPFQERMAGYVSLPKPMIVGDRIYLHCYNSSAGSEAAFNLTIYCD